MAGAFEAFLQEQRRAASGQRLEMLHRDLNGTRKLVEEVLWPVFGSFEGLVLEYEMLSLTGVKMYVDVYYEPLRFAFESNGYVVHAETITRDRYNFEQNRIRTITVSGGRYIPFSRDDLDKKPELCRRVVYELIGRFSSTAGSPAFQELKVYEREVIRFLLSLNRPAAMGDICRCLQLSPKSSRKVLYGLLEKKLIQPHGAGTLRHHEYILDKERTRYLL